MIFTVYSQSPLPSAMICYLADIPLRLAHCRENPYHLLTDWVPDPELTASSVMRPAANWISSRSLVPGPRMNASPSPILLRRASDREPGGAGARRPGERGP